MRPYYPSTDDIALRIIARVMALSEEDVARLLGEVLGEFEDRHKNVTQLLHNRFKQVRHLLEPGTQPSPERQALIGSYFTHEYSPESAALFNPSIVPHPDQSGLPAGALRFILSLRATGDMFWVTEARRAFEWFLGRNDLGLALYDAGTGGCRDGLHVDRLSQNQGAESTLAFLLALAEKQALQNTLASFKEPTGK
jgi:hypothetical protein